jgi:hypothetical protein
MLYLVILPAQQNRGEGHCVEYLRWLSVNLTRKYNTVPGYPACCLLSNTRIWIPHLPSVLRVPVKNLYFYVLNYLKLKII